MRIEFFTIGNKDVYSYVKNGIGDVSLGNPKLGNAKKSVTGFYILAALAALARYSFEKKTLDNVQWHDSVFKITDLKVIDAANKPHEMFKKSKWKANSWASFFFDEHPVSNGVLQLSSIINGLKISFKDDVEISFIDQVTQKSLSPEHLDEFITKNITEVPPSTKITLYVTDSEGEDSEIDNESLKGKLYADDLVRIKVYSNYPCYFLLFWVNAKGRLIKLHPNIFDDSEFKGYKTFFDLSKDSGERELLVPSNIDLRVPEGAGMGSFILLSKPRIFESEQILEISDRLLNLLQDNSFSRCATSWKKSRKKLSDEKSERKTVYPKSNFVSVRRVDVWEGDIVDQMHGYADRIHFLHIPLNPKTL